MSRRSPCLDGNKVEYLLRELGRHGALADGGVFRPLYSSPWVSARTELRRWMEEAGLAVHEDAVGNLFGRLEGELDGVVLSGSHVDTVKQGGLYDGALGIIAALVAVKSLRDTVGRPRKSIEAVATCEEEGSRFHSRMWGSRAILGMIEPGEVESLRDADGVTIGQAMQGVGFHPDSIPTARREDVEAFLELHIEQGPVLEAEGVPVGVVTAITGITQFTVRVCGQADHAGTTPMDLRRDPLVASGEMISAIARTACDVGRPAVATVGKLRVTPGAVNIVPGQVEFTVDLRHPDVNTKAELTRRVQDCCRTLSAEQRVEVEFEPLVHIQGTPLDPGLVSLAERVLREQGVEYKRMVSGAGHDAQVFARQVPTAMLFVPSQGGRSHSPSEFTPLDQVLVGVRALSDILYRLAYLEGSPGAAPSPN